MKIDDPRLMLVMGFAFPAHIPIFGQILYRLHTIGLTPLVSEGLFTIYLVSFVFASLLFLLFFCFLLLREASRPSFALCVYIAVAFAYSFYHILLLPAFGWDALSFWYEFATYLIHDESLLDHSGPLTVVDRHPASMLAFNAFVAYNASKLGLQALQPIVFTASLVGILSLLFFCSRALVERRYFVAVALPIFMVPLIENHIIIGGYVEVLCALCLAAAIALGSENIASNKARYIWPLLWLCTAVLLLRNTGVYYVGVFVLVYFSYFREKTRQVLYGAMAAGLFSIVFLCFSSVSSAMNFSLDLAGVRLALSPAEFVDFVEIISGAYFANSSFGILALMVSLCLVLSGVSFKADPSLGFSVGVLMVLLLLNLAVFHTEYGRTISAFGSDTGFSRFSIFYFILALVPVSRIFNTISDSEVFFLHPRFFECRTSQV